MENKITKNMTFGEVLKNHPELAQVFWEEGMHCLTCQYAEKESLKDGCIAHRIKADKLIKKLNNKIKGGKH